MKIYDEAKLREIIKTYDCTCAVCGAMGTKGGFKFSIDPDALVCDDCMKDKHDLREHLG